jgi:hypothetical protein
MTPFMITGLPRSRTAWLARFLTYGGRVCVHEPTYRWTSPSDLEAWCKGTEGMSDSMGCWIAHEARKLCPQMPLVVIRRPKAEVMASIAKLPYKKAAYLPYWLDRMNQRLDRVEDDLDCLSYRFDQLSNASVCASIFHYCHGQMIPPEWWGRWRDVNIQADIAEVLKAVTENEAGWSRVFLPRYAETV